MTASPEFMIGIDLGGTKILAAVIDKDGLILSRAKKRTKAEKGEDSVLKRLVSASHEAMDTAGVKPEQVMGIGMGCPGPLNPVKGIIHEAPNLGWKDFHLKEAMENALGLQTHLFNDVNAGTWGEYKLGAGQGCNSCIGVFVGTGIGGGIVIDGKLHDGASFCAGEVGHICLDPNGPVCGCGARGCMEAFASRTALTRDIWTEIKRGKKSVISDSVKKSGEQIRSKILRDAYLGGDEVVCKTIDNSLNYLADGLTSIVHILNPEKIILGGGVVEALGEVYMEKVSQRMKRRAFKSMMAPLEIVEARLGDDAGILGAGLLGLQAIETLDQ